MPHVRATVTVRVDLCDKKLLTQRLDFEQQHRRARSAHDTSMLKRQQNGIMATDHFSSTTKNEKLAIQRGGFTTARASRPTLKQKKVRSTLVRRNSNTRKARRTEPRKRERIRHHLKHIVSSLMRDRQGVTREVARSTGGPLTTAAADPVQIAQYFGESNNKNDLITLLFHRGVFMIAPPPHTQVWSRHCQYGNRRSAEQPPPPPLFGKTRRRCEQREQTNRRASNFRCESFALRRCRNSRGQDINDLSVDWVNSAQKSGPNANTDVDSAPPSLCGESLRGF